MSAHTPTPWTQVVLHPAHILGKGQFGNESFSIEPDHFYKMHKPEAARALAEANAALIVQRVNGWEALAASHAELVTALNELLTDAELTWEVMQFKDPTLKHVQAPTAQIKARSALLRAREVNT